MARTQDDGLTLYKKEEVKVVGDQAVRFRDVCVHEFKMGDVDDVEIYAAEPIWKWQQTEAGKWVMENAFEPPYWIRQSDYATWGHVYRIMARLSEQNETFWTLKWGNK